MFKQAVLHKLKRFHPSVEKNINHWQLFKTQSKIAFRLIGSCRKV